MLEVLELTKEKFIELSNNFNIHLLQTYKWSLVKNYGWKTLSLGVVENENCVSLVNVYIRKLPYLPYNLAYIPRGISTNENTKINQVLSVIKEYLINMNISFILIEPDNPELSDQYNELFREALVTNKFHPYTDSIQPNTSNVIPIQGSEDEILSNMRSKTRQYIRKGEKMNIDVKIGSKNDIKMFYKVLEQIHDAKGYMWHDVSYYEKIWEVFFPDIKLFLLYHNNEVVGSVMSLTSGKWVYEMYGGSIEHAKALKLPYAFKWYMIKYFHEQGFEYYDQWGTDLKYKGLMQYKSGFGGIPVNYLKQYVYVNSPVAFNIYRIMSWAKDTLLKIKKVI